MHRQTNGEDRQKVAGPKKTGRAGLGRVTLAVAKNGSMFATVFRALEIFQRFVCKLRYFGYNVLMDQQIPRVGIGVFVFKDGKFIMGCRKGAHGEGSWSVPGGHLEFGETIEEGARREVEEETGLAITDIKIAGLTNDIFETEGKHYITIWVTSRWESGHPQLMEPDKFLDLDWHDFETLPENLFLPWKELLKSDFFPKIKEFKR